MDRGTADIGKGKRKMNYTKSHCPHGKQKSFCIPCGGNGTCEHKANKYTCTECDGSAVCKNGSLGYYCIPRGGAGICDHGKQKSYCKDRGGNKLCKTPHPNTLKNPKYDGYCWCCFANLFPDKPVAQNYLTKENTVATFLKEKFPNVTWKYNKSVENGCSRRRPDLLLDMGSHIVIVEVDEHSHVGYDPTCEEKRLGEIWGDVYHRKIIFVRFNTDEVGNNVPSPPWGYNNDGLCNLKPKWKAAWEARLEALRLTVKHYQNESSIEEEFELVHLYYW